MADEQPKTAPRETASDQFADLVHVVTYPLAAVAGAYVFNAKTSDALYDNLKGTGKLAGLSDDLAIFKNGSYGKETAQELTKFHKNWSSAYEARLKDYGFTNIFKRFGGIHENQKLEVIVHSVTAIGLIIGFDALLDQLKQRRKDKADASLSI